MRAGPLTLVIVGLASVTAGTRLRRFEVAGTSMRPTLEPGDRLLVVRTRRVRPGDLAVVPDPREPARRVVKRVTSTSDGSVGVRGDNPYASTDSRTFGPVPQRSVEGRVIYRYGPPFRRGRIPPLVP